MTNAVWANFASTTLAASVTSSQTSITVISGTAFPSPGSNQFFPLVLTSATLANTYEITWCTARSGNTLTVVRAQEGTTGLAFNAGDIAANLVTAAGLIMPGRLLNVQVFSGSGTYTPTLGVNAIDVEGCGGGGGGGNAAAAGSGQSSVGSGGASGTWARARYTSGVTTTTVTIGAGGAGGSGGSTTSFGALLVLPGGGAGGTTGPTSSGTPTYAGQGVVGSSPSGSGILFSSQGMGGLNGVIFYAPTGAIASGFGGSSPYGGAQGNTTTGNGGNGDGYGAGGTGAGAGPSSGPYTGGTGSSGLIIVREYT